MAAKSHYLLTHTDVVEGRRWECACGYTQTVDPKYVLETLEAHIKNPDGPRVVEPAEPVPDDAPRFPKKTSMLVTHLSFISENVKDMYLYEVNGGYIPSREMTNLKYNGFKMLRKRVVDHKSYFVRDDKKYNQMIVPLSALSYVSEETVTVHSVEEIDHLYKMYRGVMAAKYAWA